MSGPNALAGFEAKNECHILDSQLQHIARISHGKDSLKMLDVIVTRGLPLDRITTTDVWATDTIRGEHPKMVEFKDMADASGTGFLELEKMNTASTPPKKGGMTKSSYWMNN